MALDKSNTNIAYRLGRMFAAYERIQCDPTGKDLNRTIRDAYFGAAMATPASVFPRLARLNQHHMRELRRNKPGLHVLRDKLLNEIAWQIDGKAPFPAIFTLLDQGRFTLGYYHQRQDFFNNPKSTQNS